MQVITTLKSGQFIRFKNTQEMIDLADRFYAEMLEVTGGVDPAESRIIENSPAGNSHEILTRAINENRLVINEPDEVSAVKESLK